MPFDGASYEPERRGKRPSRPGDKVAIVIIVAVSSALLIVPTSLGAMVDLVRYLSR